MQRRLTSQKKRSIEPLETSTCTGRSTKMFYMRPLSTPVSSRWERMS